MLVAIVLLFLGAVVSMCCIALAIMVREERAQRAMQRVQGASVRTMTVGDVELAGHVRTLRDTIAAPFSGDLCVQYRLIIEGRKSVYDEWTRDAELTDSVPFLVDDGTGTLPIDAPIFIWKPDRRAFRIVTTLPKAVEEALIAEHGRDALWRAAEYRVTEERLAIGDFLHVIVRVRSSGSDALDYDVLRVSPESVIESPHGTPWLVPAFLVGVAAVAIAAIFAIVMRS